ncbi:MAG TPA: DEAD/DEAH box helicase [Burkholderiales bacterium]|nr:DEAD/DEAH box helicase [Burkholderiales bacterium]
MNVLDAFHPAVANWFRRTYATPTEPQVQAWPAIRSGKHVLIAAPTGSGKTLAAFLSTIDALVRLGVRGELRDETHVVYVSPLKALSNDIQKNLEEPLAGIRQELAAAGLPEVDIRTVVRTGDTSQSERERMRRKPPHVLVTTPESLYILLTSDSGRRMLRNARTVIVDEIHALAPNKRGVHLSLSLERLRRLTGGRLTRVGLSATQKPIEEIARFLVGNGSSDGLFERGECMIVDTGHVRRRDLAIEVPDAPLEAVMSAEVWTQVYDRLAELIQEHRSTLVFVNTRRLAERAARALSERLGEERVTSHHGSLAKEQRLRAEQRLKRGELKALIATSSLELGIDVGHVDLVCQISTPRAISALLQRVGRSGHAVSGLPKGRLFPVSRDDLVECAALLDAVRREELDRVRIPDKPLDVLAQQIAAEVACEEQWDEDALYDLVRRAWPYRGLTRKEYADVVQMLAEGFSTRRGRNQALVHRDAVHRRLRPRAGLRLTAVTNGGTIPDTADYAVVLAPQDIVIGTVNEDFAVESLAGDVFQLGNASYRILRVEAGRVRVEDAQGIPPSIPFWLGEAPARSDEVSAAVSRLRADLESRLDEPGAALRYLTEEVGVAPEAAQQIVDYLAAAKAVLGLLPTRKRLVMERFFDETGGTQLVIHSPYGSRINRAWGLALRKRFCRKFNFELQAAATEDAIVLSLTSAHSFALEEVARYLHSNSVRQLLVQALLDAPMFMTRWRWDASIALALARYRGGAKVPAQLQRMQAEDLIAALFPDQLACQENIVGDREIPDHPLVTQTIDDCLHEAMDIAGLEGLLRALEGGEIDIVARELVEPSPLALEVLSARPYAYLDDAPLEERRTQAVVSRRWLDPESAADIGRLDPEAIARVREEAWPQAQSADELHDVLDWLGLLTEAEAALQPSWGPLLRRLMEEKRAARCVPAGREAGFYVAAERLPEFDAVHPDAAISPGVAAPAEYVKAWAREAALVEIVRGRLEGLGPTSAQALADAIAVPLGEVEQALISLEAEGFVMRGRFSNETPATQWCERRLLARITRYTVKRLRQEIEPVPAADLMRFLLDWQRVAPDARMEGPDAVAAVVSQLEGFEAAAAAWETELLPARVSGYEPEWLDDLCRAGRVVWTRLDAPRFDAQRSHGPSPVRATPITLLTRRNLAVWTSLAKSASGHVPRLSTRAQAVADYLAEHGASFFDDIAEGLDLPRTFVEDALRELTAAGLVNSDGFSGLRALLLPAQRRKPVSGGRRRRVAAFGVEDAGRWALIRRKPPGAQDAFGVGREVAEQIARTLLKRYGVVFWRLLAREADWLPPWRDLLMALRRLETRGEIRGGRFVSGFSGEQFALPEAVGVLRSVRGAEKTGRLVAVSGADPLNLAGIVLPGTRVPALYGNRVLYRDGVAVAALVSGEAQYFEKLDPDKAWELRNVLLRTPAPAGLAALM